MWGFFGRGQGKSSTRAERFQFEIPLHFRRSGEFGWLVGRTKNLSRSGALFQTPQIMEVNTPIELRFTAPAEIGVEAGEVVSCEAKIVRVLPPASPDTRPLLAAKFSKLHVGGMKTIA